MVGLLARVLRLSESQEARKWADYSLLRAKQRLQADSLDKKYVNVVGGAREDLALSQVARELIMAGFEEHISIVPGPLMRATHGKEMGFTHMPLSRLPPMTYFTSAYLGHSSSRTRPHRIPSWI